MAWPKYETDEYGYNHYYYNGGYGMYGYTKSPTVPMVETWEIMDSYDGGVPQCRECGQRTEVYSQGDESTIVCTLCNVSAKVNTKNLNYALATSHRIVFPISPKRRW